VSYGFWVDGDGYIRRQEVSDATFDALAVDGTVDVRYLAAQPQVARIAREVTFPWRVGAIALTALCGVMAVARRWILPGRAAASAGAPEEQDTYP
jgi:hypothetical protein